MSKVIDKIISRLLSSTLLDILVTEQHGFLKGRATFPKLIPNRDFVTPLTKSYLDFSKAFDLVNHQSVLAKLWNIEIHWSMGHCLNGSSHISQVGVTL